MVVVDAVYESVGCCSACLSTTDFGAVVLCMPVLFFGLVPRYHTSGLLWRWYRWDCNHCPRQSQQNGHNVRFSFIIFVLSRSLFRAVDVWLLVSGPSHWTCFAL
jgi:hypothetical protein